MSAALVERARRLVATRGFEGFILVTIVFNAVLVGVETSDAVMARHGTLLHALNNVVLAVFVVEIVLRLIACGSRVGRFFLDGWNVFDFVIVVLSFVPAVGPMSTVARLARVLRVVRLVSVSPELRLIIGAMLRSIPSMGHVVVLAGLLIYVYAVIGTTLFRHTDPDHWRSLGRACLTLFQVITTEGWADIQATLLPAHPWAWLYFTSYIVVAVFVVVNLFIAVVTNNLQNVSREQTAEQDQTNDHRELLNAVRELKAKLDSFETRLRDRGQ